LRLERLQPLFSGFEGVVDHVPRRRLAMPLGHVMRLVADDDQLPGYVDLDMHLVHVAGAVLAMKLFHRYTTGGNAPIKLLELGEPLLDLCRKPGRRLHVVENNFERSVVNHFTALALNLTSTATRSRHGAFRRNHTRSSPFSNCGTTIERSLDHNERQSFSEN
jgi:hypothetical protein